MSSGPQMAWLVTRLRFVAQFNPSKGEVANLPPYTAVTFLPMEAIGEDGTLDCDAQRELGLVQSGYNYFREGDVVVAKITPCFENGKGAVISSLPLGIGFGTTELIVVRPVPGLALAKYLHWLFVSPNFRRPATAAMYGAGGQKRVPEQFVRDFAIALPSISEQSLIAAFLDRETGKIDALVAEQERLITLLKEKRQAVISHAVTKGLDPHVPMKPSGVEWLGDVPKHWLSRRIKDCFSVVSGATPKTDDPNLWDGDVVWITPSDLGKQRSILLNSSNRLITEAGAESCAVTIVPPGSIVVSTRAPIGSLGIAGTYLCTNQGCRSLVPGPSANSQYYFYAFSVCADELNIRGRGTTFLELSADALGGFPVPVPPVAEQVRIATFLDHETNKLDTLTTEATRTIALLKERRAALISAAVTGKIDVRNLAEPSPALAEPSAQPAIAA